MRDSNNSFVTTLVWFLGWLLLTALGVTLVLLSFVIYSSLEDDICRPSETTRCVVVISGKRVDANESEGSQRFRNFLLSLTPVGPGVVLLVAGARMVGRMRTSDAPPRGATSSGTASNPTDIAGQCLLADSEVARGDVEAGLGRLLGIVQANSGGARARARAREHLLTLFTRVGARDPRVVRARRALAAMSS